MSSQTVEWDRIESRNRSMLVKVRISSLKEKRKSKRLIRNEGLFLIFIKTKASVSALQSLMQTRLLGLLLLVSVALLLWTRDSPSFPGGYLHSTYQKARSLEGHMLEAFRYQAHRFLSAQEAEKSPWCVPERGGRRFGEYFVFSPTRPKDILECNI